MATISPWRKVPRTPNTHLRKERFLFFTSVFVVFGSNKTCCRRKLKCKGKKNRRRRSHIVYIPYAWNVRDRKFSRIASWTKFSRSYFRECLLRCLLSCQDGFRVYCIWTTAVITADWLEEVLDCFWHVCPKAPYVLETCIDGKCSRNKCSRVWRHSRNSRKFRIANISTHTVGHVPHAKMAVVVERELSSTSSS